MKKIVAILLSITLFFACIIKISASETYKASTYIDVIKNTDDTIHVLLYISTYTDMNIAGMHFTINYLYDYDNSIFPLRLVENFSNYDERFCNPLIGYNSDSGSLNYVWSDSPVYVSADEEILLAELSFDVALDAPDGEYQFQLHCSEFYRTRTENDSGTSETIDVPIAIVSEYVPIWLGKKLSTYGTNFEIVVSGTKKKTLDIFVNKNVSIDYCYIEDSSVAQITNIENYDDNSGARISIIGKSIGSTKLNIVGGYNNNEETTVSLKVFARSPWILSVKSPPVKSSYIPGETLDLSGLILQLEYDNGDTEEIPYSENTSSNFTIGSYDFSTIGSKRIKVTHSGLSTYLDMVVVSTTDPIPPTNMIRGDMNKDNLVTDADAIYLLYYTFFPNDYPLNQNGDFNGDAFITDADAIYLLYHTFFPNDYPI